jgi:outer membrane protein OmpA-like peptidoglycan-associated protein
MVRDRQGEDMTGTKRILLGGAAVSLALVTMAATGLPARTQEAADVSGSAGLEGAALEDCLAAGPEAESAPEVEPEPEPAETLEEAAEPPEAAEAEEPEAIVDEPVVDEQDMPAAPEAVETETQGVEEDAPKPQQEEVLRETESEAVTDEAEGSPEASDAPESETTVEAPDLPIEDDSQGVGVRTESVEEGQPEVRRETEVEAVDDEPIEVPEAADANEGETETELQAETVDETDATEAIEGGEPEPVAAPEAVAEEPAIDSGAVEEAGDETVDPHAVLSEEELETAQRASIEEAVQAALAAERQKSQAQQESERDDRMRILGAAAAGLAAGAILPEIGAMLVGQQGDRVILQEEDRLTVRRDETARFLQEGSDSTVEYFADGLSLVTVTRADGSRVLSWRDASGQVVRRAVVLPDGREITLFDGSEVAEPEIRVTELPPIRREDQRRAFLSGASSEELLRVLSAQPVTAVEDRFTLRQILANDRIRWLMPSLALDAVTFDTGSASLGSEAVEALDTMGQTLRAMVQDHPQEVFLVEGHTDAVGSDISNLALSDRRAETVAMLLTSYYGVPPENLLVQGFGEQDLRVPTLASSRENRRVEVRRITPLLR